MIDTETVIFVVVIGLREMLHFAFVFQRQFLATDD